MKTRIVYVHGKFLNVRSVRCHRDLIGCMCQRRNSSRVAKFRFETVSPTPSSALFSIVANSAAHSGEPPPYLCSCFPPPLFSCIIVIFPNREDPPKHLDPGGNFAWLVHGSALLFHVPCEYIDVQYIPDLEPSVRDHNFEFSLLRTLPAIRP